jgi:hypothetical protein
LIGGNNEVTKPALAKAPPLKLEIVQMYVGTAKIVPGEVGKAPSQENKRVEEKSTRTILFDHTVT